jgi:hypothetical protein
MKFMKLIIITLLVVVFATGAFGQSDSTTTTPTTTPAPTTYVFPSAKKRFYRYLNDTAGPSALLGSTIGAGFQQISNNPPEWEKTGKGFGRRLASNLGRGAIEETYKYGVSEAFRQDPAYQKCDCTKFSKRFGHAIKSGFTARNRSGREVFSVAKVSAPFVANVIAVKAWYPDRFTVRDGLRQGARGFAFDIGFNLVREFIFKK